ncbi:MAG: hypothetical protein IPM01_27735 [Burkholderiaceae bacterium]|nr:hypothetical protein [Burkholderiaceae bacterium]
MTVGIGALTFDREIERRGRGRGDGCVAALAAAAVTLALFVAHCPRSDNPFRESCAVPDPGFHPAT